MLAPAEKDKFICRLITIGVLATVWLAIMQWAHYPKLVEHYYSEKIYVFICFILHSTINIIPFSFGDIVYIIVIAYLIYFTVLLIKSLVRKKFKQAGLFIMGLIIGVQITGLIFYLFWGMNYFRPRAAERLQLNDTTYTLDDIVKVTSMLIDSANQLRSVITPSDFNKNNDSVYHAAKAAISRLSKTSVNYYTYKAEIKPSILTPVLNYIGTSGYYNPFTGEAQINYEMPVFLRPFVACHEMSHQMGYGAEDEANFVGFIAASASTDRLTKYSAYYTGVQEFMQTLRHRDSMAFKKLKLRISNLVHTDLKADRDYWLSFENKAGVLSSILYDNFLKANNQPKGLNTYNQMVRLLMAMYKAQGKLNGNSLPNYKTTPAGVKVNSP